MSHNKCHKIKASALFFLSFTQLARCTISITFHNIQCAIEYIHTQRFQPLSTSDVAGYLNVEQTNLSKRFSKEAGMTVTNYIHTLKTDLAHTLILRRTFSLMEISDMLGYGSYHYFCKVFKKYQHCLPSQV